MADRNRGRDHDEIARSQNPADLKRDAPRDLLPEAFSEGRLDIPALKRALGEGSGPERRFAEDCEASEDVLFYFKLPRWFTIETPVGKYNPDWALVFRGDKTLYFVAETKSAGSGEDPASELLRPIERMKFECGKRHFKQFEEIQFRKVASLRELAT